jgi:hypothetical protein
MRQTLELLAQEKRFVLIDAGCAWREILRENAAPRALVRWTRESGAVPEPPDSTIHSRVLLILSVDGIADSLAIRQAVRTWGELGIHIDMTPGLETGVDDRESLRFIAWLRRQGWSTSKIGALLGKNLRKF